MIIYLVKSTLLLGLLLGVYKLLLENEKMHRFNRFFLLFALVFGLTGPLISFEVQPEQSIAGIKMQQMERVVNAPAEAVSRSVEPLIAPEPKALPKTDAEITTPVTAEESSWSISTLDVLLGMYGLITLFLLIRFAGGLIEIRNKVKTGSHKMLEHATLVLLDEPITPQSFLGYIFLEKKQFESGKIEPEILDHEITHTRQLHSLDVLFIEFLKVIFWFNPLMYLYKHAIQLNHEFLADESVVSNGSSVSDYQNMLIRVCAGNKAMNTTSNIGYSLTKKRLKMMGKHISRIRSTSIKLFIAPVVLGLSLMFCTDQNVENELKAYEFKGAVDGVMYRSDPVLYAKKEKNTHSLYPFDPIMFNENGEPFTGTRRLYNRITNETGWEEIYEEGILTETIFRSEEIREKRNVSYITYQFEKGRYVAETVYDTTETVIARGEYTENSNRRYGPDGQLTYHGYIEIKNGDEWVYQKSWDLDGQLRSEISYNLSGQNSTWTFYDEEGDIEKQTRYEDGTLMEESK